MRQFLTVAVIVLCSIECQSLYITPRPSYSACNHTLPSQGRDRILNGLNANSEQFPYMVRLETTRQTSVNICGGTLITVKWVLTAAHCVDEAKSITVHLGAVDKDCALVSHVLKKSSVTLHPEWNWKTKTHDIALLKIPKTTVSVSVFSIPLPINKGGSKTESYTGFLGIICGWGKIGVSGAAPNRLQWARLRVISNDKCRETFSNISQNKLCADTRLNASSCLGDSGGPLVAENTGELIGVISALSSEGCENNDPVVLMRVTYYIPWIKAKTGL